MKNILVVDDSQTNLMLVKSALCGSYQITTALSGCEALKILESCRPDLILLDVTMPEMDGRETLRKIRQQPLFERIPVVFLTADSSPETESECLALGADDYISKPFFPEVMQQRIARLIELTEYTKDIESKTNIDSLTLLYNRSYTENAVNELLTARCSGALFMLDLDNFKTINDRYGHIAGDKTLKILAYILKMHASEQDIIGRVGGDEFVIFYPDITQELAEEKAKTVLHEVLHKFEELGYSSFASVSIGIALAPEHGTDFTTLYTNADKSLYHIKRNGKNAYHFFNTEKKSSRSDSVTTDLNHVRYILEGRMDMEDGAFHVAYDEFQNIYNYISRYLTRKQQEVQAVLFTLQENTTDEKAMADSMLVLKKSIISSLRKADVATRYSSCQYVVILMDSDAENGKIVAERIVRNYYDLTCQKDSSLSFDIQTLRSNIV